jgi:F0F1-type ATP synthase epsilon subunit
MKAHHLPYYTKLSVTEHSIVHANIAACDTKLVEGGLAEVNPEILLIA